MTAGATKEKKAVGTHCSRGWPCLRARVILLDRRQFPLLEVWQMCCQVVIGSGLQAIPGAVPRYRASPVHQDSRQATALLSARGEREQVCEGENAAAGSLPLLLIVLPLTTHFGIRTPSQPFSFTEPFLLFTDSLRNISSASHGPRSSPAELSSSNQHLLRERKSSAPSHSSQPTLFTFEPPVSNHMQPTLSTSAPQEYLYLHQCISRRAENARQETVSSSWLGDHSQILVLFSLCFFNFKDKGVKYYILFYIKVSKHIFIKKKQTFFLFR